MNSVGCVSFGFVLCVHIFISDGKFKNIENFALIQKNIYFLGNQKFILRIIKISYNLTSIQELKITNLV